MSSGRGLHRFLSETVAFLSERVALSSETVARLSQRVVVSSEPVAGKSILSETVAPRIPSLPTVTPPLTHLKLIYRDCELASKSLSEESAVISRKDLRASLRGDPPRVGLHPSAWSCVVPEKALALNVYKGRGGRRIRPGTHAPSSRRLCPSALSPFQSGLLSHVWKSRYPLQPRRSFSPPPRSLPSSGFRFATSTSSREAAGSPVPCGLAAPRGGGARR